MTIICCLSGTDVFVPPMMIFPRVKMKSALVDKALNGTASIATKSGWVNEESFGQWFDHFLNHVQPKTRDKQVVVIMDGRGSHTKNLGVIDKARDNCHFAVVTIALYPSPTARGYLIL